MLVLNVSSVILSLYLYYPPVLTFILIQFHLKIPTDFNVQILL